MTDKEIQASDEEMKQFNVLQNEKCVSVKTEKLNDLKNRISFALKDATLQQGFEIICKRIAKLEKECEQKMLSEYARQTKSDWSNWYAERLNDICRYIQKNYRALFMDGFSKYQDAIAKDYRNRKKAEEASLIALEKELATLSENDLAQEIKKGELLMKELIAKNV